MSLTGNSIMKKESMNSIIHIRNVVSVSSVRGKTVLNLFRVCAIWMSGITGMKAGSYIGRRRWHRGMTAVISM